ncbi:MAG: AAA family ATPase [Clostridia bacterium]|nr:AAA family ATPase [Clostridia bacterium]
MGKIFAVTSGKGGVGKSTVSVGLALAFCSKGRKVLLVDMDEGLRCLDLMLGVDKSTVFDLSDVLLGKDLQDAVYKVKNIEGLNLIPAPSNVGLIDTFSFSNFAREVSDKYDIVIFDFPAGMDFSLYTALPEDTLFLAIACPDAVSVRDSAAVSRKLGELNLKTKLIINNFDYEIIKSGIYKNIDDMIDESALQLIGIVPSSAELRFFAISHSLKKRGKANKAFLRIADRLENKRVLLPKPKKI